jgi:hypothetical protein
MFTIIFVCKCLSHGSANISLSFRMIFVACFISKFPLDFLHVRACILFQKCDSRGKVCSAPSRCSCLSYSK